jgi:hypothetical protein
LEKIENLIEQKRGFLEKKKQEMENKDRKHNEFLKEVRNDYLEYNNKILQQKRDQVKALEILDRYIKDLVAAEKGDRASLEQDQEGIMAEIRKMKKGLDDVERGVGMKLR